MKTKKLIWGLVAVLVFGVCGAGLCADATVPSKETLKELIREVLSETQQNKDSDTYKDLRGMVKEAVKEVMAEEDAALLGIGSQVQLATQQSVPETQISRAYALGLKSAIANEEDNQNFGVLTGVAFGPYHMDTGYYVGGFYDFTIIKSDPHRLSGEIFASYSRFNQDEDLLSPVAEYLSDGLAGVVAPVLGLYDSDVEIDLDAVNITLGGRYTLELNDIVRPYAVAGLGIYVFDMDPANGWVAGILPLPKELKDDDFPTGNADAEIGLQAGVGVQFRVHKLLSLDVDYRYNWVNDNETDYQMLGGGLSFHF